MKITSVNNDLIKESAKLLKSKYRNETGLFLIEGEKGLEEAIRAGLEIKNIFALNGAFAKKLSDVTEVSENVMAKLSDAKTPPKVVAVARQLNPKWSDDYKRVILLEGIKDPGNLGTILRAAAGFGIDAIVLYGDTVDLYNPKTVRSTVGNLWKVPVFKADNLDKFNDYERVATLPRKKNIKTVGLNEYSPKDKVLIMFGSEAEGLSDELKDFATVNVTIETDKCLESLNLSVSAAIVMYKLFISN